MFSHLRRLLLWLCVAVLTLTGVSAKPLEILFVGNSYVFVNDLPAVFAEMATASGQETPKTVMHAPGGQTLSGHSYDRMLQRLLKRHFDVVILQEQSQMPARAEINLEARKLFLGGCERLSSSIRKNHPDTRIILFQTWSRNPDTWNSRENADMGDSADEMQRRLHRWYAEAAKLVKAEVAPVGDVWQYVQHQGNTAALYSNDGSHPDTAGTYLTALVMMRTIYGKPVSTRFDAKLSEPVARQLQSLVNEWYSLPETPQGTRQFNRK